VSILCHNASLPEINRAGEFPLLNPVFDFTYRGSTSVIHLYGYDGKVRINSREYRFRSGDLTCIQGGSIYSIQSENPGKHWCIHFREVIPKDTATFELPDLIALGTNSLFLREQIRQISSLFNTLGTHGRAKWLDLEARHRLKALLISMHNLQGQTSRVQGRKMCDWNQLLSWIDDNLNRLITTADLARQAGVGSSTLAREFKRHHHATVSRYLLHRRMDRAKSLLATTTLPVQEIGSAVGIADPQYFNKQFRKIAGKSPRRYREEHRDYLDSVTEELAVKDGQWPNPKN
jgi:AraC-like DNA-binding protein